MKKWLTVVEDEQYEWIKKMAAKVGTKGAGGQIVKMAIARAMHDRPEEIVGDLLKQRDADTLARLIKERDAKEQQIQAIKNGNRQRVVA